MRAAKRFHVIDASTLYYLLLVSTRKMVDKTFLADSYQDIVNLGKMESPSVIGLLWCDGSSYF